MISEYYLGIDIYLLCENFANRVVSTNIEEYSKRKQIDTSKIVTDILYGKLAEWGVYFIYLSRGRTNISTPDMIIYPPYQKSFDADLTWGLYQIHVKSQTFESANKFGESWIFQAKDPLFVHPSEYDILIGCRVQIIRTNGSISGCLVEIRLEKPVKNLKINEPKMSKFKTNKKAIYLKDNDE